jgi:hypothetical protein
MQITLTPPGGTQVFTLGDDTVKIVPAGQNFANGAPGSVNDGYLPKQTRLVQKSAIVRGAYKIGFPRYNLENSLTFEVTRTFTSRSLAFSFLSSHADLIPVIGTLTELNVASTGRTPRYLPNAMLEDMETIEDKGLTNVVRYLFWAPNPWQSTAP